MLSRSNVSVRHYGSIMLWTRGFSIHNLRFSFIKDTPVLHMRQNSNAQPTKFLDGAAATPGSQQSLASRFENFPVLELEARQQQDSTASEVRFPGGKKIFTCLGWNTSLCSGKEVPASLLSGEEESGGSEVRSPVSEAGFGALNCWSEVASLLCTGASDPPDF